MITEYETALLGAVLAGYRDVPSLARMVTEPDFLQPRHGEIWLAALAVHNRGDVPDPLTVRDQLGSAANRLPGGPTYLTEFHVPVVIQAPFYASKVREASIKRQIAMVGAKFQQIVEDDDTTPDDMLIQARAWIENLDHIATVATVDITTALEQVIDVAQNGEQAATPTGWSDVNEIIGGWYPGQLIVVGARPGVGKSLLLENAATDVARNHKRRVLFVSLEMTAKEITQRTMAHTAGVPLTKIRAGQGALSDADWEKLNVASGVIGSTPITFKDTANQTMAEIRSAAWEENQRAIRNGEELGLVVIDYIQLIRPQDRKLPRQQQIGEITRSLKQLAKELQVPVLTAAQLNREAPNRTGGLPILSDLREAGDIEQDADNVLFLHEEFVEDNGTKMPTGDVQVIVAKQRNGPLGTKRLRKYGHYARLANR